jgi:hypothetical protein
MFLLQSPRLHKRNSDSPSFNDCTQTPLFSSSFTWFHIHKSRDWLPRACSLFLTFHKQIPSGQCFLSPVKGSHSMFPQNLSERCGALAVSDLVRILLSCNDLVRLRLMAPNNFHCSFTDFQVLIHWFKILYNYMIRFWFYNLCRHILIRRMYILQTLDEIFYKYL